MSSDGSLLYGLPGVSSLSVRNFPSLTLASTVDLDPAMDALGAGGAGNIRAGTVDDAGNLYAVGYITSSTNIQIMRCQLDGSSPTLLWTAATASSTEPEIGWHPADPGAVFVLYGDGVGGSLLVRVDTTSGTETTLNTFAESYTRSVPTFQQYDDGLVFFVGTAGSPTTGTIWVYDIVADAFDSIPAADSFNGMGTRPDGLTYWSEDSIFVGGDQGTHAFTITSGPTITELLPPCSDPWVDADGFRDIPLYWFAIPDRSEVYAGSGSTIWRLSQ